MITQKATIAEVKIGDKVIEGLMLPDGSYRIAVTQVAGLLSFDSNQASRSFKALLGNNYQFDKAKSVLHPKAVNTIKLPDFMKLLTELVSVGNIYAKSLLLALAEESIERRFNNAFGQKCSEDEYNERLKARMQGIQTRRTLTDAIKDYITKHNITGNEAKFMYANTTNALYISLSGHKANKIRKILNLDPNANVRDFLDSKQLKKVDNCEDLMIRLIDQQDMYPLDASDHVVKVLLLEHSLTI